MTEEEKCAGTTDEESMAAEFAAHCAAHPAPDVMLMGAKEIAAVFSPSTEEVLECLKRRGNELYEKLDNWLPETRETAIAKTKLEEALMWAERSIMLSLRASMAAYKAR